MKRVKLAAFLVILGLALSAPYYLHPLLLVKLLCFALFAVAFNFLLGHAGLLSFGHAAFFGGGAYFAGYFLKSWGVSIELCLLSSVFICVALGWLFGSLAIRKEGIYFAMITLGLAQLFYFFCAHAQFTGGEDGLQQIPRGRSFGLIDLSSDINFYYYSLVVVLGAFAFVGWIVKSPFGLSLFAISQNERRAKSLGLDTNRFKLAAFAISAALTGLAGSLKAVGLGVATLTDVDWHMSGEVVLMALVGGVGTSMGPIIGAIVIVVLESKIGEIGNYLAALTGWPSFAALGNAEPAVIGTVFIICVLVFRRGIVGELMRQLH